MTLKQFNEMFGTNFTDCLFESEWCVGGITGGSCWDTGPAVYHSITAGDEPNDMYMTAPPYTSLTEFLEKYSPNMTFLQHKILMNKASTSERTSHDYYGNYTEYRQKRIPLVDVIEFLSEKNILVK